MPRTINETDYLFIDDLVSKSPVASYCVKNKQLRQLFVEVAKIFVGIKEQGGQNHGKEVELFLRTIDLDPGNPWCMAFVQTCLRYVEKKLATTSSIFPSGLCMEVWNRTNPDQRVKLLPLAGAIAIWQHKNNPSAGHTGIVLDCDGVSFHLIEGNTSEGQDSIGGRIGQGGDGVRLTHRSYDLYNIHSGDLLLIGCLKPF